MKNFIVLAMVSVLAACSSSPKDAYERRAYEERERQEKYAEAAIDKAPKWMTTLPKSTSAIYASATETSSNMSMADEKAKQHAFGNNCMAAGGEVVLAGFYDEPLSFVFPPAFMREARIRIAAQWLPSDLVAVKDLAESGRLSLEGLITHRSDAMQADSAYRTAFGDPTCLKMILDWRSCQ
jgi:2-desacetyl-2-hydroxyethyl bacteriochlorophyllide A dehydrogenase